jgi:hypothetical protein
MSSKADSVLVRYQGWAGAAVADIGRGRTVRTR